MRARDIITEKAIPFGAKEQAQVLRNPEIMMGFEAEFVLSIDVDELDTEREERLQEITMVVEDLTDWDDIKRYFTIYGSDLRNMREDWRRWIEDLARDTASDYEDEAREYDPDFSDEEVEGKAFALAKEAAESVYDSEEDYVWEKYKGNAVVEFNFTPLYGWAEPELSFYTSNPGNISSPNSVDTITSDADLFDEYVVNPVQISLNLPRDVIGNPRGRPKDKTSFYIDTDGSVSSNRYGSGEYIGVELVSPPMRLGDGILTLGKVLKGIDREFETNESTGLHIGLSVPNIESVDKLKLLMFIDEDYVANLFGRSSNIYTMKFSKYFEPKEYGDIKRAFPKETGIERIIEFMNNAVTKNIAKYRSVNFTKLENGYLEFRLMGGEYASKWEQVKPTVLRFANALVAATNPNLYKREYYQAVYKMAFGEAAKAAPIRTGQFDDPENDKAYRELLLAVQKLPAEPNREQVAVINNFLNQILKTADRPSPKATIYLKNLLKTKGKLILNKMDTYERGSGAYSAVRQLINWGVVEPNVLSNI